jgi:hypothetical protein
MRNFKAHLFVYIIVVVSLPALAGDFIQLHATITGNVQLERPGKDGSRVATMPLTKKTICDDLSLEPSEYVLVYSSAYAALQLLPKSGGQPIEIFHLATIRTLYTEETRVDTVVADAASTQVAGLFKGFQGTVTGRISYKSLYTDTVTLRGIARGTDPAPQGNTNAILSFRITTGEPYVAK